MCEVHELGLLFIKQGPVRLSPFERLFAKALNFPYILWYILVGDQMCYIIYEAKRYLISIWCDGVREKDIRILQYI